MKKPNLKPPTKEELIEQFKGIMEHLDKGNIAKAFKYGHDIGFFGKATKEDNLNFRFGDNKYTYTITRRPHAKINVNDLANEIRRRSMYS